MVLQYDKILQYSEYPRKSLEHQAGLEPVTLGLGSRCSAIELLMHTLVFPSRQSLYEIPLMNLSRDGLCRHIAQKIKDL